ncbi:MAG: hypothetical protein ACR2QF_02705 [Geminicoccaceae bacterium]
MKRHTVQLAKSKLDLEMMLDNASNKGLSLVSITADTQNPEWFYIILSKEEVDRVEYKDPWMLTRSGLQFEFLSPRTGDIDIEDIAVSLARKVRFNGHNTGPVSDIYVVAQHSCLVHDVIAEEYPTCRATRLWALLHDATEAYLPDVHTELKERMPGFRDMEDSIEKAIANRFNLPPMPKSVIKHVDRRMLATERRDVMSDNGPEWESLKGVDPYETHIIIWSMEQAHTEFMDRYNNCIEL